MAHHLARYRARRNQRDDEASILAVADQLRGEFREACIGLHLCQYVQVAAGITVRTARVGEVRIGPPTPAAPSAATSTAPPRRTP